MVMDVPDHCHQHYDDHYIADPEYLLAENDDGTSFAVLLLPRIIAVAFLMPVYIVVIKLI